MGAVVALVKDMRKIAPACMKLQVLHEAQYITCTAASATKLASHIKYQLMLIPASVLARVARDASWASNTEDDTESSPESPDTSGLRDSVPRNGAKVAASTQDGPGSDTDSNSSGESDESEDELDSAAELAGDNDADLTCASDEEEERDDDEEEVAAEQSSNVPSEQELKKIRQRMLQHLMHHTHVVLDEAGAMLQPDAVGTLLSGCRFLLCVGDHRQVRPCCTLSSSCTLWSSCESYALGCCSLGVLHTLQKYSALAWAAC
jgi:hypothetical protein